MEEEDRFPTILPLSRVDGSYADPGPVSSGVSLKVGEQAVGQLGELLPQMIEAVPTPILVIDSRLRVLVANAEARQLLSGEEHAFLGYSISRFLSVDKLEAARSQLLSSVGKHSYRDTLVINGVEREVEVSAELLTSESGDFLCMTLSDYTNADRERAEWRGLQGGEFYQERLERAHHLEALGHLTGSLAHDFNNLLAVILGSLEAAERRVKGEQDPTADLARAKTATERSIQSTSQILRYARHRGMIQEPLYPAGVLLELRGLIERAVGDEISLIVETRETSRILVSAAQLETTILNLVINARDAMGEAGGEIHLGLDHCILDEEQALLAGLIEGDYVRITVADDGHGMTPELQERVFEPFFTTKAEGLGTGLGLSTVRTLMRKLGGAAHLRSVPGAGTTVELLFPAFPSP